MHTIRIRNGTPNPISFWLGDVHTSAEGVLECNSWLKWTFAESRIPGLETHQWFIFQDSPSHADKFSLGGFHTYGNGNRTQNVGFGDWEFTIGTEAGDFVVKKEGNEQIRLWGD